MKTLSLDEAGKKWDEFFRSATKSLLKAEVLQDYSAIDDGPSLQAWLRGDKEESMRLDIENPDMQQWFAQLKEKGLMVELVHVVDYPLTPYLEWEVEIGYKGGYRLSGMYSMGLVDRRKVQSVGLPDGDFWIFDDEQVVKWTYEGPKGKCIGGNVYEKGEDISFFLTAKTELLKLAEPVK